MELGAYLSEKHKKRRKRRQYFYVAVGCVIVYILCVGSFWFFLRSPIFHVSQVTVQGNGSVPSADVITLLRSAALRDHNFFKALLGFGNMLTWPNSLTVSELAFIPKLSSVTLSKSYFSHTITVNVTEREPFAIWCFGGGGGGGVNGATITDNVNEQCYWFDGQGIIFGKAFDTEGGLLVSIHDYSQARRGLNQTVLPARFMANFISILNALKASGMNIKAIALNDLSLEEIDVTTYNGLNLYFSLRFSADEDLPVLQSLMTKPDFGKLQYIDFRVANRAYYK